MIKFRPGQQWKQFTLVSKTGSTSARGRVSYNLDTDKGTFTGAISKAAQEEIQEWAQNGHPITHKVVVRGATTVEAADIIIHGERKWYVQGAKNCAEVGIFSVIYCKEQLGVGTYGKKDD